MSDIERWLDNKMYDDWEALNLGEYPDDDGTLSGFWNEEEAKACEARYNEIVGFDTYDQEDKD